jgi:uncharacterized repeat protein (TIGR03803 family)
MTRTKQYANRISAMWCKACCSLALGLGFAAALGATPSAQAQTFTTLYSFAGTGGDGSNPNGGMVRDGTGNLYGTTFNAGSGFGTVFKLDTSGVETILHTFAATGGDGQNPFAGLVRDAKGNLYGTTVYGGAGGAGTVFMLDKTGTETVLYSFAPGVGGDGSHPYAGLVRDASGNLYGTTVDGGAFGFGTVFELDTAGKETVLYSFAGTGVGGDGANPLSGLIRDASGNLYGTTLVGGACACGLGTVFKLDTTGKETVLHSFTGTPDGATPEGVLVRDASGNLYGTTGHGGSCACGLGTVFKLATTGKETVLHSFTGTGGDGGDPRAGVVRDGKGNLYGTTLSGGINTGIVFMLDKTGKEAVLHSFTGMGGDGASPYAGLIRDPKTGTLYGTTLWGGTSGLGTVFQFTP